MPPMYWHNSRPEDRDRMLEPVTNPLNCRSKENGQDSTSVPVIWVFVPDRNIMFGCSDCQEQKSDEDCLDTW